MLLLVRMTYGGCLRDERAHLRHRHLVLGERLQQHGLQRLVGAVDLVDEQDHRLLGTDRLQQRARREEPLGEEHALLRADPVDGLVQVGGVRDDLADLLAQDLGVEQLLAVVPLVEGLGLVLALVALQPQQPPAGDGGQRLGELGLADAGRALDEQRLVQPGDEEDGGGQAGVGDVAVRPERVDDLVDGREGGRPAGIDWVMLLRSSTSGRARVVPDRPGGAGRRPAPLDGTSIGSGQQVVQVAVDAVVHHRAHGLERALLGVARACRRRRGRGW